MSLLCRLFWCCLQRGCDGSSGAGAGHRSHTPVSRVSLTTPTPPGLPIITGLPPGVGPQDPSVQPLAPHTHRALDWALFLSWILPCSTDPNFYSTPETFCSAFPPSSILFIFHYLLQSPDQTPGIFLARGETQNRLDAPRWDPSACRDPARGALIHPGGLSGEHPGTPSPCCRDQVLRRRQGSPKPHPAGHAPSLGSV